MQVVSNNCSSYLNYPETSGETAVKGALPDSRMRTAAADAELLLTLFDWRIWSEGSEAENMYPSKECVCVLR